MIVSDRAVERRIKRANTDWWIHEEAVVGANGKTYIAYFNDIGKIHVKEEVTNMPEITLAPLSQDDREQFILDNQEAFNYGALEEFGLDPDATCQ